MSSLVIQEPSEFYSESDEELFFMSLKSLPEIEQLSSRAASDGRSEIVLSLKQRYLSEHSLRSLLGLLMRYDLPMSSLKDQCGDHNASWFADKAKFWHKRVFSV